MNKYVSLLLLVTVACFGQACSDPKERSRTDQVAVPPDTTTVIKEVTQNTTDGSSDTLFAQKAAVGGMSEVALGRMAAEKATDRRIRDFGTMMATDHAKANEELKLIASKGKLNLPKALDPQHVALGDSLDKFNGKAFDKAYVGVMLRDHKMDLILMIEESMNGRDPALKAFAAKTAPLIEKHLDRIQDINDSMQ